MLILITGRSGVGKSEILNHIFDFNILKMDDVVKNEFYISTHEVFKKIVDLYGTSIVKDNRIDTSKLGQILFNSEEELLKVSNLIHPYVRNYLKKLTGIWIVEMATYINYQNEYENLFDKIILITKKNENIDKKFIYMKKKENPIKNLKIKYDALIENDETLDKAVCELKKLLLSFVKN